MEGVLRGRSSITIQALSHQHLLGCVHGGLDVVVEATVASRHALLPDQPVLLHLFQLRLSLLQDPSFVFKSLKTKHLLLLLNLC